MLKIRIRFSKSGPLRYIGHLDFLKVFQQTIRRAGIPIAYSQGFNPHQQLSFALPLPLGMTSLHDYADITLESEMPSQTIISLLNTHAPSGLDIAAVWPFEGAGVAALTAVADYHMAIDSHNHQTPDAIKTLLNQENIIIPKKTKSGIKDTDIRPDILNLQAEANIIKMRLSAGSARFINPLAVAKLILNQDADISSITRAELYRISKSSQEIIPIYEAPIH